MPETDQGAGPTPEAGSADESSPEGAIFVLEDDQGLDVLEGLAQEDRPQDAVGCPAAAPASAPSRQSSSESSLLDALSELGDRPGPPH